MTIMSNEREDRIAELQNEADELSSQIEVIEERRTEIEEEIRRLYDMEEPRECRVRILIPERFSSSGQVLQYDADEIVTIQYRTSGIIGEYSGMIMYDNSCQSTGGKREPSYISDRRVGPDTVVVRTITGKEFICHANYMEQIVAYHLHVPIRWIETNRLDDRTYLAVSKAPTEEIPLHIISSRDGVPVVTETTVYEDHDIDYIMRIWLKMNDVNYNINSVNRSRCRKLSASEERVIVYIRD